MKRILAFLYDPPYLDYRNMVFFRVGVCALLLTLAVTTWQDYPDLYGANGAIQRDVSEVFIENYMVTSYQLTDLISNTLGTTELQSLLILRWIYVGFILLLAAGCLTRFSAIVVWLLHLAYAQSSHYMSYGVDYIHTILLFYCILFPVGARYSVDTLLFKPKLRNIKPFVRLLQLHLCVIYLVGGIGKLMGENWWNGESIWKSVHRPFSTDSQLPWLADYPFIPQVLGISVIVLELLYVVMIWWKPTRSVWLWLVVGMHMGIAVFMGLPLFSATMIIFNLSAFYFFNRRPVANAGAEPAPVPSVAHDSAPVH